MFPITAKAALYFKRPLCLNCRIAVIHRYFSQELHNKYTDVEKNKILEVINDSDTEVLAGYDITKGRLKKFSHWKIGNGKLTSLSELESVDGFSEKSASKLFDSILQGPPKPKIKPNKIRGQVLHPVLTEKVRQDCQTIVSVYVAVNSVCWSVINRSNYEVLEWKYYSIDYPEGKRFQITDIFTISWQISQQLPNADIYVMKAEPTTLRAAGSDPNNPKVITVNLQKAQMVAMIIALINARCYDRLSEGEESNQSEDKINQKVYFLRPTLPYRLYGTLVGNEKVATDQTVEMLLQNASSISPTNSHVYVPDKLQSMFRNQKDLQKDMLGHCLLLGLTFMDVCVYKNQESIRKLVGRGD